MSQQKLPLLLVPEPGHTRLYLTQDGHRTQVWPPKLDSDALLDTLKAPLMKMMLFRSDAGFSAAVAKTVRELLAPLALRTDGGMRTPLSPEPCMGPFASLPEEQRRRFERLAPVQTLSDAAGEENLYCFHYNFLLSPFENADALDACIDGILRETGAPRLRLLCVGFAAPVCAAYLDAFGEKDALDGIVFVAPAFDGTPLVSAALEKKLRPEHIPQLVAAVANGKTADAAKGLFAMMPEGVLDKTVFAALDAALDAAGVRAPALWALVPKAGYPALADRYLAAGQLQMLRQKTDRWHALAGTMPELLRKTRSRMPVTVLAGSGLPLPRLFDVPETDSDGAVPAASAALADGNGTPALPEDTLLFPQARHDGFALQEEPAAAIGAALQKAGR